MTDLELAVLNTLCVVKSERALTLADLHSLLVAKGFAVRDTLCVPRAITDALITLEDKGLIRNELSWHALPSAENKP